MSGRVHGVSVNRDALLNSPELAEGMLTLAEPKLQAAIDGAPVATGEYQAGLHLEQHDGGEVRIAGSSDHDIYVEADTGNLARALDA